MELQDMQTKIRTRYGIHTSDTMGSDAIIVSMINDALARLNLQQDWPWMETAASVNTAADSNSITLAADVRRVVRMRYQDQAIQFRDPYSIADYYNSTGKPWFYTYEAGYRVLPTADAIYALDYIYIKDQETELVNATDEPAWPNWAMPVLFAYVCSLMARAERMLELAQYFYAEYERLLATMNDDVMKSIEGRTPHRTRYEDRSNLRWVIG